MRPIDEPGSPPGQAGRPARQAVGPAPATSDGDEPGPGMVIEQLAMSRLRQFGSEVRVHSEHSRTAKDRLQAFLCNGSFANLSDA
jgi:hypothetical protein